VIILNEIRYGAKVLRHIMKEYEDIDRNVPITFIKSEAQRFGISEEKICSVMDKVKSAGYIIESTKHEFRWMD
jgi:hypothetical protein